jgi:hypothetical protein
VSGAKLREYYFARALGRRASVTYVFFSEPGGPPVTAAKSAVLSNYRPSAGATDVRSDRARPSRTMAAAGPPSRTGKRFAVFQRGGELNPFLRLLGGFRFRFTPYPKRRFHRAVIARLVSGAGSGNQTGLDPDPCGGLRSTTELAKSGGVDAHLLVVGRHSPASALT